MVKHTQAIRLQKPTSCLSVIDLFVGLELKGLISTVLKVLIEHFAWDHSEAANIWILTGKHLWWSLFLKKKLQCKCFPMDIAKFLRTPILKTVSEWLLLVIALQDLISGLFLVRINFQQNCSLQLTWILAGTITVKKTSQILKKVGEFSRNMF